MCCCFLELFFVLVLLGIFGVCVCALLVCLFCFLFLLILCLFKTNFAGVEKRTIVI